MNIDKVIEELNKRYPGKALFKNNEENTTEILCELEPAHEHPEYSNAVAVIDRSFPHIHLKTLETYKILKGALKLHIGNKTVELNTGDTYVIKPGNVHWAEGDETWVECYSNPGWLFQDHAIVNFVETVDVREGVKCDVYEYVQDSSKDLGIITISPGKNTPLQRVLNGDKTIEGYISGKGKLTITKPNGQKNVFEAKRGLKVFYSVP